MDKSTTKKPTRRRKTTALEPPDEHKVAAADAAEEKVVEPITEEPAPAQDTRPLSEDEIPVAEVIPEKAGDERQAEEEVAVYFRRVREASGIAVQAEEPTDASPPPTYHDDTEPRSETTAFAAARVSGLGAQGVATHLVATDDTLLLEPAVVDFPLPPLPVLLFALILLGLAL